MSDHDLPDVPEKSYAIRIDDHLHRKLEKHLKILKFIEHQKQSKQNWIVEAVKDKLKRDLDLKEIPKDKRLVFKIDNTLSKQVSKQVDILKKFKNSYSKKQWFVEAINEKLEKEESKTKEFLEEIQSNS